MDTFYGLHTIVLHTQVLADVWIEIPILQIQCNSSMSFVTQEVKRISLIGSIWGWAAMIINVVSWYKGNNLILTMSSVD